MKGLEAGNCAEQLSRLFQETEGPRMSLNEEARMLGMSPRHLEISKRVRQNVIDGLKKFIPEHYPSLAKNIPELNEPFDELTTTYWDSETNQWKTKRTVAFDRKMSAMEEEGQTVRRWNSKTEQWETTRTALGDKNLKGVGPTRWNSKDEKWEN